MHTHRRNSRRLRAATALLSMVALVLWAVASTPPAQAQPAPTTVTFEYTGAAQTWTVPAGVTSATFDVFGAQGGSLGQGFTTGGRGGRAMATIPLTPATQVVIMVGGAGSSAGACPIPPDAGGFNGGAPGGGGVCQGAGGGGASDIRMGGTDLAQRVLVAGGGGGSANIASPCGPHDGGAGGGPAGATAPCGGGSGGNQDGTSGSGRLGSGSAGADGNLSGRQPVGGGGGGGGYYGGAGGPQDAGGGGGSGFGPAGVMFETGVRTGNGRVVITYTPPPPPPPTAPTVTSISPSSGPDVGGTVVTITGAGFSTVSGATEVTFGSAPATSISCASTTQCSATSPSGSGTVSVRVTVAGRTSPAAPASAFTYVSVPPSPPPSPSPLQPMTLTVQVWRILPPLVSEAQVAPTVVPVGRATVEARIGDTLCGQGVTDSQGRVQLVVAADPRTSGCGRAGALVTFRVNGVVAQGEVRFAPGGSTDVAVRLLDPIYLNR